MSNRLDKVHEVLLMGPGPSCVYPEVYRALARPTIGHLDPLFIDIMDEVKSGLRTLMQTANTATLPMSGTGSAGMEAGFANLLEAGDAVLVLVNGVFGKRMADVAGRLQARVDTLEFDWGTPVAVEAVAEKLADKRYTLVAVVHAETSTGVCNPVAGIGAQVNPTGALYLVDAVTSLGGMPVCMDDWGVDLLYSGSQKCLSCPPGLAPLSASERALAKLKARQTRVPNWYLDLSLLLSYWDGARRAYHHTAPINMIYALHQALQCLLDEGLEHVFERHRRVHRLLVAELGKLGLEMLVAAEYRLPMLNAVKVPLGVDEAGVRARLLARHRIEIGAGLGPLAGKIWRIGLMGHTAREHNVHRLVEALHAEL
ncbi:MAG: alanine--glyoxylate aminotransferase family protein [Gammaproteobacteria bacterium]|nr:alanine--glyoxylate aminotransferase family protein [Gammaproteobacteria bacterium]